jgi:hypothetical protein
MNTTIIISINTTIVSPTTIITFTNNTTTIITRFLQTKD